MKAGAQVQPFKSAPKPFEALVAESVAAVDVHYMAAVGVEWPNGVLIAEESKVTLGKIKE